MSVGTRGIPLGTVVVDDAHACLTTATEQFSIRITEESLYDQLLSLFEDDLKGQSASGLLDIKARDPQAVMAVPCGSRTSMGFCCPLTPATGLACTVLAPRASPPPQPAADNERAGFAVTLPGRLPLSPLIRLLIAKWRCLLVPRRGFEPPTHALRMRCSTG